MKIIRISFENFEKDKETVYILAGDFAEDKKLLKKKIYCTLIEKLRGECKL